ncbi:MAG: radical SAM protein [Clostridium sp.]|nr:radical SAM protein [Clostridium sp.]MCM1207295.1 radical SAM protein [Ruminococcus sp.]
MEEINEKLYLDLMDFNETKRNEWMKERKPYAVLFELTARCNMNCIHCYLQNNHVSEQLSYREVIDIIDLLYDIGILFITFTGGEILTRDDFPDIYIYAKKKGFLVELFSNGYLFDDNIIDILKEYPPLLVDISIYGSNEKTYKKITGIDGAFKKVILNCEKLKKIGVRVSLKSPIILPTLEELDAMKKLAERLDIPFVYTFDICATIDKDECTRQLQVPMDFALKNEFLNYYEQIQSLERVELENDKRRKKEIKELIENNKVYACNVALNSFVIDYKGNICPCMKLRHKGEKLNRETFDLIWDKFKYFSQKKATDTYVCKGCEARYYCDVCPAEMDFLYGNDEIRPFNVCKIANIRKNFYCGNMTFEEALRKAAFNE